MDCIDPDSVCLICLAFADELMLRQTLEGLQLAAIVVGCAEGIEILS